MSEARIIPLHADESGSRTRWRLGDRRRTPVPPPPPVPEPEPEPEDTAPPWEESVAAAARFLRRRLEGDYAVDDFGFDVDLNDNVILPVLRPLYEKWFRTEAIGMHNVPDVGRRARRGQPLGHPSARRADDRGRAARRPSGPPPPADARRRLHVQVPRGRAARPQAGRHAGLQPGRGAAHVRGRARRRVAGGVQRHRQAVPRPLQAAALRPRRLRDGRAAHRGADHPVLDRRRRGDLPQDRRHQAARPAARRPVLPGYADVPAARAARAGAAAVEVADRVRRADPHRHDRRRATPTTR